MDKIKLRGLVMKEEMMPRNPNMNKTMREKSSTSIIKAGRKLFATKGYGYTTIADIAKEAKMSTGNIYWYFEGKLGLLKSILAEGLEAQDNLLNDLKEAQGRPDYYEYFTDTYISYFKEYEHFVLIAIFVKNNIKSETFVKSQINLKAVNKKFQSNYEEIKNLYIESMKDRTDKAEYYATLFFAFLVGLSADYNSNLHKIGEEELKSLLYKVIMS